MRLGVPALESWAEVGGGRNAGGEFSLGESEGKSAGRGIAGEAAPPVEETESCNALAEPVSGCTAEDGELLLRADRTADTPWTAPWAADSPTPARVASPPATAVLTVRVSPAELIAFILAL